MNRIGFGIDHHVLIKKRTTLMLGGCEFESEYDILAHSDGDLIFHALANAILSALNMDDIGTYFSDQDKNTLKINSQRILNFALQHMYEQHYTITNIALVVESDHILINSIKGAILTNLKKIFQNNNISLHGNRNEIGLMRISCYATILLTKNGFEKWETNI